MIDRSTLQSTHHRTTQADAAIQSMDGDDSERYRMQNDATYPKRLAMDQASYKSEVVVAGLECGEVVRKTKSQRSAIEQRCTRLAGDWVIHWRRLRISHIFFIFFVVTCKNNNKLLQQQLPSTTATTTIAPWVICCIVICC
jgi:hypothetical protein